MKIHKYKTNVQVWYLWDYTRRVDVSYCGLTEENNVEMAYRWKKVTCKNCLKHKPKDKE